MAGLDVSMSEVNLTQTMSRRPSGGDKEQELLNGLKAGRAEVFDVLFLQAYQDLWRFAYSILHIRDLSEDTVQDVLIDLWEKRETIEIRGSLFGYLLGAVRRRALWYLRRDRTHERIGATWLPDDIPGMGSLANPDIGEKRETLEQLKDALQNLSPVRRQVLFLRWGSQLSYSEISEIMEMSPDAVRAHVSRAYRDLRKLLVDAGMEPPAL